MLKVIKLLTILLLILFFFFGFLLFSGIKIDSFSFGNFSVSQFYLKLDKKLILEVEEIDLDSKFFDKKEESSPTDINDLLQDLKFGLELFESIDIERIKILDNEFTILLNEEQLYIDNEVVNLSAKININSSLLFFDIYSLYIKDIDLALMGKSKMNLSKNEFDFYGNYHHKDVDGEINAMVKDNILDTFVNTTHSIKSLKFLKEFFRLDEVAETWMYDNVKGDINLEYLYAKIDLEKKVPIMESIKGKAVINNAKIRFNENAQTVDTDKLTLNYKDDTLSFDLFKPRYNKSELYGSKVYITDLTSLQRGIVNVNLVSKSILNDDILEILKANDIKLPLKQKSGQLQSSLRLKIPYLASKKMEVIGDFKLKDAVLKLNDFEFTAFNADVALRDNIVDIKSSHIKHKEMLDTNLNLVINTSNSTAKGEAKIKSFSIKSDKESIVDVKKLTTKIGVDFKANTKIDIKTLDTKIDINKEHIDVDIKNLQKIYPYSNLLKNAGVKKGDLQVKVYDEKNIDFFVNAKELDYPFEKNGQKIKRLKANGKIKGKSISIETEDKDIQIILDNGKNPLIKLNNVDLVIDNESKTSKKELPNIDLELKNSFLILDKVHKYKTSWANIYIKNSKIKFKGEALYLNLPISKNGKQIRKLQLNGNYENRVVNLETKDKKLKLKYELDKEKISMDLENFDVIYNTNQESDESSKTAYYINGKDSNIVINEKYIAKADKYKFVFENYSTDIDLTYKKTTFNYKKNSLGYMSVDAKNMNDEFLNALISKNLIRGGLVNLKASGKNKKLEGQATIDDARILDLALLNNLLILINTSPAIINPFLAIPSVVGMATNEGFNLNGYRVVEGGLDFVFDLDKKYLNMHKIKTTGNGIDFDGYATINFENSLIDSRLNLIFMKDYSKIVGSIPVINYVLLGDKKRVDTQVEIYGTLEEPKYKTKLVEEGVSAPINVLKRVITSPLELLKSIGEELKGDGKKE